MFFNVKDVIVLEMQRPLSLEIDVILRQRLKTLQHECQMTILINNNAFIKLPNDITLTQVNSFLIINFILIFTTVFFFFFRFIVLQ